MKNMMCALAFLGMLFQACTGNTNQKRQQVENHSNELLMFVGSYAPISEEGIKIYSLNQETGAFTYLTGAKGVSNPSFLALSSQLDHLYAVGEDEGSTATVNAFSFDKQAMRLTLMNSALTYGGAPCNVSLSPQEDFVLTANYFGGNVSIFPLKSDGSLQTRKPHLLQFHGTSIHPERQTKSYLHSVRFTQDQKYLIANDLGADKLYMYPVLTPDAKKEIGNSSLLIDESKRKDISVEPGSGPRHLCIHPNGVYYYLITELSGKVISMRYENETLTPFQYIAADTVHAEGSADIHCTADGRFVYASNRLKADGIAIFKVDQQNGELTKIGYQLTGTHPRNFIITPNDKFLLVACRDTNEIQIYQRDRESGLLQDTGKRINMEKPVCLKLAQR